MGLREFVELFDKNYASPEMKLYYEKLTETV